jgi:hypothetical protein
MVAALNEQVMIQRTRAVNRVKLARIQLHWAASNVLHGKMSKHGLLMLCVGACDICTYMYMCMYVYKMCYITSYYSIT